MEIKQEFQKILYEILEDIEKDEEIRNSELDKKAMQMYMQLQRQREPLNKEQLIEITRLYTEVNDPGLKTYFGAVMYYGRNHLSPEDKRKYLNARIKNRSSTFKAYKFIDDTVKNPNEISPEEFALNIAILPLTPNEKKQLVRIYTNNINNIEQRYFC